MKRQPSQDIEHDLERRVGVAGQLPPLAQPVLRQQPYGCQTITGRLLRIVRDRGHNVQAIREKLGAQLPHLQRLTAGIRPPAACPKLVAFLEWHVDSVSNSPPNRALLGSFGKAASDGVGSGNGQHNPADDDGPELSEWQERVLNGDGGAP